ncbi:MAG TPA: zinc-ribbon domain-containing protein [Paracoccaceae bacterium]|nr:zinc-ribbon domain-containing protein [Paracoccaceae bacterium]
MRLTCPNCDAQYEVDDSAIPDTGRDVQCSNCGHAWFQLPPDVEAALEAEEAVFDASPRPAPPEAAEDDAPPPPVAAVAPAPSPRRALDENLMAILREEAERETAARRAERARGIEVQPDLGLDQAASMPPMTPLPEAAPSRPASRRELLPDIEEINSTLRASDPPETGAIAEAAAEARARSGFRTGFVLVLLVAVLGVAVYAMAPRIAHNLPASAPAMQAYVATIDGARLRLDGAVQGLIAALRGLSGA